MLVLLRKRRLAEIEYPSHHTLALDEQIFMFDFEKGAFNGNIRRIMHTIEIFRKIGQGKYAIAV